MFGGQTFMFEPTLNLFSRYVSTVGSKRRCVRGCRRKRQMSFFAIGCWLFIYWCSEDLNKLFSPNRNRFLRRTPTSQDRFDLRQLLWPDYSTYKSFDSSTKVISSLHVVPGNRLLCVISSEMNCPPSLKLHDATQTDQSGGILKITTHYDTEPRIDWK